MNLALALSDAEQWPDPKIKMWVTSRGLTLRRDWADVFSFGEYVPLAASEKFKGKSAGGLYGDAVEEIDESTGRVLDALRELDLDDRTLVPGGPTRASGKPVDPRCGGWGRTA